MTLNKQIWVKQITQGFYPEGAFLQKATDYSELVENNKIHIASAGIDPEVLINNSTYPIATVQRTDKDNEFELDTLSTQNTVVRRPEAIEYSYNKLESVISQHRNVLRTAALKRAAHAFAPASHSTDTPIIQTSGEAYNGRKRLCFGDILALKEAFDNALIPTEDRYIVLHPSHLTDLLKEDLSLFKDLTNIVDGEPIKMAGFGFFSFPYTATYQTNAKTSRLEKVAFSSEQTNMFCSVAFYAKEVMKADGDIHMYSREDDPEERGTIVGFDKRFIALPIRNKGIGAIVSATASTGGE